MQQLSFGDVAENPRPWAFTRVVEVRDSAAISRLAYHPSHKVLRAWFLQTDTCWEYHGVWPSDFAKVVSAYSVGKAFNEVIRDRFEAVKVEERVTKQVPATKGRASS